MKTRFFYYLILAFSISPLTSTASDFATVPVKSGSWEPTISAMARVSTRQQATLSLPFAARIIELKAEPGAVVTGGAELARFDAPRLRQNLTAWQQSRQELKLAQRSLDVLRASESERAITRREVTAGEQAVLQAKGNLRRNWETLAGNLSRINNNLDPAKLAADLSKDGVDAVAAKLEILRAPFPGTVTNLKAAVGEQLRNEDPVLEIEALNTVYLDVSIPQPDLPNWKAGKAIWHTPTDQGELSRLDVAPLYDKETGLWQLRFLADNKNQALRDGLWVNVVHYGPAQSVLWVPEEAVVSRDGKTWCVIPDGTRYRPVEVKVGQAVNEQVPILSGLSAENRVVTEGSYELLYRDLKELIKFVD